MVGVLGLEPRSLAAQDFESSVFTNFTILPFLHNADVSGHSIARGFLAIITCPKSVNMGAIGYLQPNFFKNRQAHLKGGAIR